MTRHALEELAELRLALRLSITLWLGIIDVAAIAYAWACIRAAA